jgi:uncharacterized membrane protein YhaH (DUF805 family)
LSFGEAIRTCFQKYADFRGRASRPEFCWFVLLCYILIFALAWPYVFGWPHFDESSEDTPWALFGLLTGLAFLALLLPYLALGVRRLHDTGKSGAWWFIGLVPFGWSSCSCSLPATAIKAGIGTDHHPVYKPPMPRRRASFHHHHLLLPRGPRELRLVESDLDPRVPSLTAWPSTTPENATARLLLSGVFAVGRVGGHSSLVWAVGVGPWRTQSTRPQNCAPSITQGPSQSADRCSPGPPIPQLSQDREHGTPLGSARRAGFLHPRIRRETARMLVTELRVRGSGVRPDRYGPHGQRRFGPHDRAHQFDLVVELPPMRRGQVPHRFDGDGEPST